MKTSKGLVNFKGLIKVKASQWGNGTGQIQPV
jgi:hypothetical protein